MVRAPPFPDSPWSDPAVVLASHQLERVRKLQRELDSCTVAAERAMICRQTRDSLLDERENLEILFAICRDVMEASEQNCTSELDESWQQFRETATKGAKLRAVRAKALQTVADRWGAKVVHHYGWGMIAHRYCQQLRAAANEMDWPTFVRRLNQALLERHWAKSLCVHPIAASMNPITQPDILKARRPSPPDKIRLAKGKSPSTEAELEQGHKAAKAESERRYRTVNKLFTGLGLDRFGVVVRKEFDDQPTSLDLDSQDGNQAIPPESAARNIDPNRPPPIDCNGLNYIDAARLLPAQAPVDIRASGGKASPFPPSPPSSPDSWTASTLPSDTDREQAFLRHFPQGKRLAPTLLGRATKRQRILSPTVGAAADAKKVYILLARLQAQGSPLASQPQFVQTLEWIRKESERDNGLQRETSTTASHLAGPVASPPETATVTRRPAPSFLDQVLLSTPARQHPATRSSQYTGCDLVPSRFPQRVIERSLSETAQTSTSPKLTSSGIPKASVSDSFRGESALWAHREHAEVPGTSTLGSPMETLIQQEHLTPHGGVKSKSNRTSPHFQSSTFILHKEQAIWALQHLNAQNFTLILLKTALDQEGNLGSCVTFTVPTQIAQQLTDHPGELPDHSSVTPVMLGNIIEISESGVRSAVLNGSSYFLNIPRSPNQPFITVWTTLDVGEEISLSCAPSLGGHIPS